MQWKDEIVELHDFFQRWFLGDEQSMERVEMVLAPQFTMVGPHGAGQNRAEVLEAIRRAHAHTRSLTIETSDHRLLTEHGPILVAEYTETHRLAERSNERLTTVVFVADDTTPHGVAWLRAHETFILQRDD